MGVCGDQAADQRRQTAFRDGIELAVSEVNATGGVDGRMLKAILEDTQYKPLPSSIGARKLSQIDGVSAVLISTITEAKAAGPMLQKEGVPSIVLWDSSPEVEALGDFFFGIGPWAPSSGERTAEFAASRLHAKTAMIVSSNTEWSQYVARYFTSKFTALGGTVVRNYALNPDELDFRTTLTKARAADPDVLYAPVDGNIIPFYKQLKQMKVSMPVVTSDIVTDEYLTEEPASFEGVYQTMTGDPDFPASKRLYESYKKHFGKPITQAQFVAWGYDGVRLIALAARTGTERLKIKDALHSIKDVEGASGTITMNERGSAPREVHIFQVKNGAFTLSER